MWRECYLIISTKVTKFLDYSVQDYNEKVIKTHNKSIHKYTTTNKLHFYDEDQTTETLAPVS